MTELYADGYLSTLVGNITTTTRPVTFRVAAGAAQLPSGNFRVRIDDERFLITAIAPVAGGPQVDYTGSNESNSVAAVHAAGADVEHLLTAASLQQLVGDHVALPDPHSTYVRKGTLAALGDLFVATAAGVVTRLARGPNRTYLGSDDASPTGLSFSTPPGSSGIFPAEVQALDFSANGLAGSNATQGARFAGGTTSGAPTVGTFRVRDYVIDGAGVLWTCITAGAPGTWTRVTAPPTFLGAEVSAADFLANGVTGTLPARFVGATTGGPPTTGTAQLGDFVVARTGGFWVCTIAGSPGFWVQIVPIGSSFSGYEVEANDFKADGILGATQPTRFVGSTSTGAPPTAGTFLLGDFVIDTGATPAGASIWVCVNGGTPGTWSQVGGKLNTQLVLNGSNAGVLSAAATNTTPLLASGLSPARWIGGASGPPAGDGTATFNVRDFVIDTAGTLWVCTVGGTTPTWREVGHVTGTFTTQVSGTDFAASGLTGASSARFVGGTSSGAPTTGTFQQGDFVIDRTGFIWVCITAGSPGSWANIVTTGLSGSSAGSTSSNHLSSDVALTTPATFYDGPSLALAPGIWLLVARVTVSGAAARVTAKLWDGTTVLDSGETTVAASPDVRSLTLTGVVQPATLTTYKISATATAAGVSMRAATPDNAAGNTASTLVAWSIATPSPVFAGQEVSAADFNATGLTGATAGARFAGATASGAPTTGSFSTGDFVVDRTGQIWVCITSGTPGTWNEVGVNTTATEMALALAISGLPGATTGSRYVGATAGGPPVSGTFLIGDYVLDITGRIWVCTTGGTPGIWQSVGQPTNTIQVGVAFNATGLSGANTGTRLVGGTTSGAPTVGSFVAGDFVVDQGGKIWICTTAGSPGTWIQAGSALTAESTATDYKPSGLTGATQASRYAGATLTGAPSSGTFQVGDYVVDQSGKMWVCTAAGSPGTWVQSGSVLGSESSATDYKPTGLTGATAATRYAGGTVSGPPLTGAFVVGDWIVDQGGRLWICTVAGSPGTWTQIAGGGSGGGSTGTSILTPIAVVGPLTVAQATIPFPVIPQTFRSLQLAYAMRGTDAAAQVAGLQFNGDSAANYDSYATEGAAAATAQTSLAFGVASATGETTGHNGAGVLDVPNYLGTAFWKTASSQSWRADSAATDHRAGQWHNTAAITSLTLVLPAGSFDVGSYFVLYGVSDSITGSSLNNVIKQTRLRGSGNKTTLSTTFVVIDNVNLAPLTLTLNVGDLVRCELQAQTYNSGSGYAGFDFQAVQPTLGTTRLYASATSGGSVAGAGNRMSISNVGYFTAAEAGAHTLQPVWFTNSGTQTLSNATSGPDDTEIVFSVQQSTAFALVSPANGTVDVIIDGLGVPPGTGIKGDVRLDANLTIVAWRMYADVAGSAVLDIWKAPHASFPPTVANSIVASAPPTLTSAAAAESTTLTGWNRTITKGDILRFSLTSASVLTRFTIALEVAPR